MIAIIGAGITGLTLGELLSREMVEFKLFEATSRVGGNIKTIETGPYTLESGPNSLIMNDELYDWISELGLTDQVVYASPEAKNRYVLKNGQYLPLPKGPASLLSNNTLSWNAKRRLWKEPKQPYLGFEEESIDHFFRRRLGDEITDYLVYPFISGIYAGDPKALLVKEAFPNLVMWEEEYGSILKGFIRSRKGKKHKGTFSFKGGLQQLTDCISEKIADRISLNTKVVELSKNNKWRIKTENGDVHEADQVVFTLPAHPLSRILSDVYPEFGSQLLGITYPPVCQVYTSYKRSSVGHKLSGFGALHNQLEPSNTLGTIFSSTVFPGRCPEDEVLLTTFIGGALSEENALKEDQVIYDQVIEDHKQFLEVRDLPVFTHLVRWTEAIPQYDRNVLPVRMLQEFREREGLFFGGNWIGGISVISCIKRAHIIAEKLINQTKSS